MEAMDTYTPRNIADITTRVAKGVDLVDGDEIVTQIGWTAATSRITYIDEQGQYLAVSCEGSVFPLLIHPGDDVQVVTGTTQTS